MRMGSAQRSEQQQSSVAALGPEAFLGLFVLSVATLMFEVTLTRLFSVAQFYHFAFMIVSMAMLGFGAGGTWLALRPTWGQGHPEATTGALALGSGLAAGAAYLVTNWAPFDSFSLAWDGRQVLLLSLQYLVLSLPFFCTGAVVSLMLQRDYTSLGPIYAVNLGGSAVGCLLALLLPGVVGGEGVVWLSAALSALAALALGSGARGGLAAQAGGRRTVVWAVVAMCVLAAWWRPDILALRLSPYKGLSYALQVPGAEVLSSRWNGFSRVDVVASEAIRSLPGLSYRYPESPPSQLGLFVDGDDMTPVVQAAPGEEVAKYLPSAIAYALRPEARALVLAPRGGLEAWVALGLGAQSVTVVESNPLVIEAVGRLYEDDRVAVVEDDPRSYVTRVRDAGREAVPSMGDSASRSTREGYDVVVLALTSPYRPIRSGAYTLAEEYAYTVEAFEAYLKQLGRNGILVVHRWLQMPPSETLRAFALAVTAIERLGGDPGSQIVAFRGYAMMTFLISPEAFSDVELALIREFADARAYDIVIMPGMTPAEANRHNRLASPVYYEAFGDLPAAEDREAWYAAYAFDVRPPTDDHPFFGHFFKWSQAPQVLAEMGKTWQPFGGAGYFVLVALLLLSGAFAVLLIGLPVLSRTGVPSGGRSWLDLLYFGCLGVGFLFVEIPMMQQAILFLGEPAYAVTVVLASLLLSSGLGSLCSGRLRVPLGVIVGLVVVMTVLTAALLPMAFATLLGLGWGWRVVVTATLPAPLGFLMGMPFPMGLRALTPRQQPGGACSPARCVGADSRLPWAWAVNGAMSVVASVLAALMALSLGFTSVLIVGAGCYAGAALIAHFRLS